MPYIEARTYQNGLTIRAEYSRGGIWLFSGDGKLRPHTKAGWTRAKARRFGDELGGAEPDGEWFVQEGELRPGDIGPCHEDGCYGELAFRDGPDPNRQGTGVAGGRAISGHCNAKVDHTYVARIFPDK